MTADQIANLVTVSAKRQADYAAQRRGEPAPNKADVRPSDLEYRALCAFGAGEALVLGWRGNNEAAQLFYDTCNGPQPFAKGMFVDPRLQHMFVDGFMTEFEKHDFVIFAKTA